MKEGERQRLRETRRRCGGERETQRDRNRGWGETGEEGLQARQQGGGSGPERGRWEAGPSILCSALREETMIDHVATRRPRPA